MCFYFLSLGTDHLADEVRYIVLLFNTANLIKTEMREV